MKYGKFTHILSLLATIPEPRLGNENRKTWEGVMTPEEAVQAMDNVLEYMLANFQPPPQVGVGVSMFYGTMTQEMVGHARKCSEMLQTSNGFIDLLESIPPYYSEILFPISVIRYMLREKQMPINHRKSKYFTEFFVRYGALVLADY